MKLTFSKPNKMQCKLLYKNRLVENIYIACTCCYDKTKPIDYMAKKEYIEKRVKAGHDSILEHGRLSILFTDVPASMSEQLINFMGLEHSRWLEFYTVQMENGEYNVIVNSTIRGYKHFLNNLSEDEYDTNELIKGVCNVLQENTVKELYGVNNYIEYLSFIDAEPEITDMEDTISDQMNYPVVKSKALKMKTSKPEEKVKMITVGFDDNPLIDNFIELENQLIVLGFSLDIIPKLIPVMVGFFNMSRTSTHQLVRHRNAITQESQRYVSAENATFTVPVPNYDGKEYQVNLFGTEVSISLTELANELIKVYKQLADQGLKKEEARAFLPSNVNCGRLYMTFTMESLFKFIELRTDPHAQYEIRMYAEAVKEIIEKYTE